MTDSSADRDPLERLAEDFVARYRRGERPSLTEYTERHPELADQVRDLFPALVEMEQLKPVTADRTGAFTPQAEPSDPARVGEFRILRRVGRGGMGVVYEAVQESLGRHVALKILPPESLLDPNRLERFRREARAAARLHHTNIVPVFGVGEADGRHFYAMQFIDGHPLDAVIDEVRRLKEKSAVLPTPRAVSEVAAALLTGTFAPASRERERPEQSTPVAHAPGSPDSSPALSGSISEGGRHYWETVARIGAQVADGLAYAHGQGVLHRDIKPANLLLDLRGTVWVADFGLAKANDADDLTHAGDVVGTLRYMAPERFDGPGDHRADVYALGLTLYELLTLRPAFAAENRAKLVEQVTAARPPSPRSVNPQIPRDLETIVLKAIQRDPVMRYQGAAELADDLRRFTEDRPIRARRASSAEQAWRWCRRNKAVASLIAAVLLVFAAGAGVSAFFAVQAENGERAARAAAAEALERQNEATAAKVDALRAAVRADLEGMKALAEGNKLREEQDFTRRLLYASRINLAQAALNDDRIPRVIELLRDTTPKPGEPDLRNWEWHYLNNLLRPDSEFPLAAPGEEIDVLDCVLSSDGTRVLVPTIKGLTLPAAAQFYTVRDTLTGRTVGRVPKTGNIPLAADDGPGSVRTDPVFSLDGRYVYVRVSPRVPAKDPNTPVYVAAPAHSRLWSVETGESVPAPAELAERWNFVLGPDAAWAVWFDVSQDVVKTDPGNFLILTGLAEVTCSRWDRASGKVTKLPAFKIGEGYGWPVLTPDGGTVYWVADSGVRGKGGTGPPVGLLQNPWFECWDVTGGEPKRLFQLRLPRSAGGSGAGGGGLGVRENLVFSPSGTMAAYRTFDGEVVVYRMSDGEVHARLPLTGVLTTAFGGGRAAGGFFSVSDDGDRVVFRSENQMTVLEKTAAGGSVRNVPVADLNNARGSGNAPQSRILADGKTYVQLDRPWGDAGKARVRVWDLSRDPNRFVLLAPPRVRAVSVERDGQSFRQLPVGGGRLSLEWPHDAVSVGEGGFGEVFGGPFVVRDADGKILAKVTLPAERYINPLAELLADGRHLLTHFTVSRAVTKGKSGFSTGGGRWGLYDLARGGEEIAGGTGSLTRLPQAPYLIDSPNPTGRIETLPGGVRSVTLRHAATGGVAHRIEMPNREVRFCEFDPSGKTYLVESVERAEPDDLAPAPRAVYSTAELAVTGAAFAGNPDPARPPRFGPTGAGGGPREGFGTVAGVPVPVRPVRVHLFDAATHRELHAWDVAPDSIRSVIGHARFSPDGKRILFRYVGGEPDMKGPPGMRPDGPGRLWVARPDGRFEHDVALAENPRVRFGGLGGAGFGETGVVCSPDGRHAAVPVNGEVQLWDLDAGKLRHTLTGHGGQGTDVIAVFNSDGSRLFTVLPSRSNTGGGGMSPIHVWDTATGRELLTLAPGSAGQTLPGGAGLELVGEKLRLLGFRGVRTYDGTPVKP